MTNDLPSPNELEKRRADRLDEKRNVTGRISDTCRFIGFGLLAVFYTLKSSSEGFAVGLKDNYPCVVLAVGIFGGGAILFDYIQYWAGSRSVERALNTEDFQFDPKHWSYITRGFAFAAKQALVFLGVIALIGLVFAA